MVYRFADGKIEPERLHPSAAGATRAGHKTRLIGEKEGDKGVPFPAAIAVVGAAGAEKLLVADNLSDDVLLLDAATGTDRASLRSGRERCGAVDLSVRWQFRRTDGARLSRCGMRRRLWNSIWTKNTVGRKLALLKPPSADQPGTHPCAFALAADGKTLYVALANRDAVAAVNVGEGEFAVKGYFDTRLPGQSYFGAEPVAVALNGIGSRLYVANMAQDAVAVIDTRKLTAKAARAGMVEPTALCRRTGCRFDGVSAVRLGRRKLLCCDRQGQGTGPNNFPQRETRGSENAARQIEVATTSGRCCMGRWRRLTRRRSRRILPQWTQVVLESNRMKAAAEKIPFAGGAQNPIKHVIYIIKENRTYDQILGDLEQNGKPVGNGDPSLTMYGAAITPNHAQAGAAVWRARQLLSTRARCRATGMCGRMRRSARTTSKRPGSSPIAASSARTTTRAWWPMGIRCCRRFPM